MNMVSQNTKIFGIGLNKTGTTTLGQCGKALGYLCKSCDRELLKDVMTSKDFSRVRKVVSEYDLFEDWPWPLIYNELDLMFPSSKFILTVRKDEDTWLRSMKKHSMRKHPTRHCRKLAYGYNYPYRHEKKYIEFYKQHNKNVKNYFKGRENDFIELCWETGDGWNELCNFLGAEIPDIPFPHANKSVNQRVDNSWVLINKVFSKILN